MANYQSIPARFNKVKSRINHRRISSIIRDKQNTIDSNFGIMSESVDKVLGTDFANPEDSEMLKNKVSDVLNVLDSTDSIQFDSKKARFTIQDALNKVSRDPEVLKEIANTKKIRSYQSSVQKAIEDGTYNEVNDMYSRSVAGLSDYMKSSDEGRNKNLGNLHYTPYYDYKKEGFEIFNEIQKNSNKEITKLVPDSNVPGKYNEITYRPLTANQVRQMTYNQMSSKAKMQMGIEGSALFNFTDKNAQSIIESKVDNLVLQKNKKEEELSLKLNNNEGLSPSQISSIEEQIKNSNSFYDSKISQYNSMMTKSALEIGVETQSEEFLNFLIPDNYGKERLTGVEADEAYFKNMKLQESLNKANKAGKGKINRPNFIDRNEDGVADITTKEDFTPLEKEKEALIDLEYKSMTDSKLKANQFASNLYNGNTENPITPEQRAQIDKIEENYKKELQEQGITITDDFIFNKEVYKRAVNSGTIEPDEFYSEAIDKAEAKINTYNKRYNESVNLWQELKAEDAYKQILNSDSLEIIDEQGNNVNLKNKLANEGIKSSEDFLKYLNSDKGRTVKANLMLGSLGKEGFNSLYAHISGETISHHHFSILGKERFDNLLNTIIDVKNTLGVQGDISEHISIPTEGSLSVLEGGYHKSRVVFNPDSELTKFLKKSSENEGGINEFHFSRQTPEDASLVKSMFDTENNDEFRDFRIDLYKQNRIKHKGFETVIIQSDTPVYNELKDDPLINIPDNHKKGLFLRHGKDDTFDVYIKKTLKSNEDTGEKSEVLSYAGNIKKSRIQNQDFKDRIDYNEDIELLDYGVEYNTTSYAPRYEDSTFSNKVLSMRNELKNYYTDSNLTNQTLLGTKEGLSKMLKNTIGVLERIPQISSNRVEEAKTISDFYQSNFDKFRLRLTGSESKKYMELIYQDSDTKKPISVSVQEIPNVDPNLFRKKYYKYPQIYMAGLIQRAVSSHDPSEKFTGTSKLLTHLRQD